MNSHVQVGDTFVCSCGKICSKRSHIQDHVLRYSGVKFPCSFCGKNLSSPNGVQKHEKAIHGKKQTCQFCPFTATAKAEVMAHVASAHPELDKFPCEFHGCPYKATSRQHLGYHLEVCKFAKRSPDLRVKGVREEQITLVKALFKDTSFDKTLNRVRLTHREVKRLDPSNPEDTQKYLCDTVMDFFLAMLKNDTHEVQFSYLPAYFFGFLKSAYQVVICCGR